MFTHARTRRDTPGPHWNEGARLFWLALLRRDTSPAEARALLQGSDPKAVSDGPVYRWLYGDQLPGGRYRPRIAAVFGVPAEAWELPAQGGLPMASGAGEAA